MSLSNIELGCRWLERALVVLIFALNACAAFVDAGTNTDDADNVGAYGFIEASLTSASLLSANGTYGAACVGGRANTAWSLALQTGAALDNATLSVVKLNATCVLSLTALRVGAGSSNLYTAASPIVLTVVYPATATLFTSSAGSFMANAKLAAVTFAADFVLTVLCSSDPSVSGDGSASAQYTYDAQILAHDSPLSYWRLDEVASATDDFTGTAGTALQTARAGLAFTWAKSAATTADAVLTDAGRARANGTTRILYVASASPSSADYTISADVHAKSLLADDQAGVLGRAVASADTYYFAGYVASTTWSVACLCFPKQWQLWKTVAGVGVQLDAYSMNLTVGNTYKVALHMHGTLVQAYVDGVLRLSATDVLSAISPAGNPGVLLGLTGSSTPSNTTGLHLDNFALQPLQAADAKSSNPGTYYNSVTLGDVGALTSSVNKAVTWAGTGYIEANRAISDDFSIEFWYKAAQGTGASVTQWYNAAGLVDANTSLTQPSGFGVSVRSDGKVLAGAAFSYPCPPTFLTTCTDQATIVSSGTPSFNAWHHVAFTRTKASGGLALYIDGASAGTATGPIGSSLTAPSKLNMGRLQTGANFFTGSLDEVAVYSTVLSGATVLTHYQHR